jgi:hypothetical protein
MHQTPNPVNPALIRIAWFAIVAFLLLNVALMALRLANKPFNPDEFQHLHIAWLIAHGKILYRDFWEHHGPLYSLFNGSMIYLFDAEPTVRILFWSRSLSLFLMCGIGALTWFLARTLGLPTIGAWLAVAIFASLDMVQNKGVEMRPDIAQTLFWLAGLLILLKNQSRGNVQRAAWAGAFFTLCILSNAKAGIGPFFATLFYVLAHWLCQMKWQIIRRDLIGMASGGLIAALPVLIYFVANDSAADFLYFNYVWNVLFNLNLSTTFDAAFSESGVSLSEQYFWLYFGDQLPFTLLVLAGGGFWVSKLRNERAQDSRQRNWLFAIVTSGTLMGWLTNQYSQYFLIFLPLLSIVAAYALIEITKLFNDINGKAGIVVSSCLATLTAMIMLAYTVRNTPFRETDLLSQQKSFTKTFVSMTSREEPVGVLWSLCGGYMFNENTGFYWVAMPFHSEMIEIISGEHPFREAFIHDLDNKSVRYIIGVENWMTEGLSPEALKHIQDNFNYTTCLWTRKTT